MGTFRETKNGLFYKSYGKSTQPGLFSMEYLVKKLYAIGTSVANIARRTGMSQDEVRRLIGLKK